jgi:hypothetical protein
MSAATANEDIRYHVYVLRHPENPPRLGGFSQSLRRVTIVVVVGNGV